MVANATRDFDIVITQDEDGYFVASVPALPGCHTQATSIDELLVRSREAIEAVLESETLDVHDRFVGVQRVTVSA